MRASLGTLALVFCLPAPLWAQDESSPTIEVGSRRIGGPGTSTEQRARAAAESWEEEEVVTEETLVPKGHKKRLAGLHSLAKFYWTSKQFKEACTKFDMILEEAGEEGLATVPEARAWAAGSYFQCARSAFTAQEPDKAEKLLKKSEQYGPSDHKHAGLREKMARDAYRKKLANGDVSGAVELFEKVQAKSPNEDERIWLGEELAKLAVAAEASKDELGLKDLMAKLERVAPMNTEYRALKEKLAAEGAVFKNLAITAGIAIGLVLVAMAFGKWRANARVKKFAGGGFDDL